MKKSQAREHFEAAKDEDRAAVFAQKHPKYEKFVPERHIIESRDFFTVALAGSHIAHAGRKSL